ncbi:MAG: ATP-binding cassette domain-containing protein [Acidobacteria bacterium]|nr:ATP-binding cassette domain-containing protein [Acidobacteriota bacterium]
MRETATTAPAVLEVQGVSVAIGRAPILRDVSLSVGAGEALGVIGPNGSGKTTLLDVISGLVEPSRGRVLLGGRDVTGVPPHRRARLGMTRGFQHGRLYPSLTTGEVIAVGCESAGARRADTRHRVEIAEAFGLTAHDNAFVSELSTGLRRILDLAVAAARSGELGPRGNTGLLLLDEPADGLAHGERTALLEVFRAWRERSGCSLVIVEHDLAFLAGVADRVIVLEEGTVAAERDPREALAIARAAVAASLRKAGAPRAPGG